MPSSLFDHPCLREWIKDSIVYLDAVPIGIIKPSLMEGVSKDGTRLIAGPLKIIHIPNENDAETITSCLIESGSILFGSSREEIFTVKGLLENPRLSRQVSHIACSAPNCLEVIEFIEALRAARVLIVGCGGIGSLVCMQLAGAGIKNLTVVDPDAIEDSNLNRQFFWERKDLGRNKVDVLREVVQDRFDCQFSAICQTMTTDDFIRIYEEFDVVIISADEPLGISDSLKSVIKNENSPVVFSCGYYHDMAIVNAKTSCDIDNKSQVVDWYRCPNFIGPSYGPINVEISAVIASAVLRSLGCGWEEKIWMSGLVEKCVGANTTMKLCLGKLYDNCFNRGWGAQTGRDAGN